MTAVVAGEAGVSRHHPGGKTAPEPSVPILPTSVYLWNATRKLVRELCGGADPDIRGRRQENLILGLLRGGSASSEKSDGRIKAPRLRVCSSEA